VQLQESGRGQVQVWLRKDPVGDPGEVGGVCRQGAMEAGLEGPLGEANLAWAGWLPISWISSLCADPTDSPRPKGWETTLEPYRTLNLESKGSNVQKMASNQLRPSFEDEERRAGFMHPYALANLAFMPLISKLSNGIIHHPFHVHCLVQAKHKGFVEWIVGV
jgi:hypothetical protein